MKLVSWSKKRGRCKRGASAKAKGRAAVQLVRKLLLDYFPLHEADVYVKTGSQPGEDIHLSPAAQKLFPFDIEVKGSESLNIYKALEQAQNNATKNPPIVFFKKARTPMFVAMPVHDFLKLVAKD